MKPDSKRLQVHRRTQSGNPRVDLYQDKLRSCGFKFDWPESRTYGKPGMKALAQGRRGGIVPKRRQRHYSYDESLDETAGVIANEPAEIGEETPAKESDSVERLEVIIPPENPVFEE
jgi:hypothetical protein